MKARQAKAGLNPGPGSYDVKRPSVTGAELAGSAAFKSKSDRKNDVSLKEVGDPGSYNPYDNATLAAQTSKSFNKSQQTGAGEYDPMSAQEKIGGGDSMFKNKDERFKKSMELEYSAHVGPGSYSQADRTVELDFKKSSGKVSSAFASTTLRADSFLPGA